MSKGQVMECTKGKRKEAKDTDEAFIFSLARLTKKRLVGGAP